MATLPRGVRNNNPLNIRHGASSWMGARFRQTDPDFVQFRSIEYGFRAAFKIIYTYYHHYGLNTLQAIIGRWAPESENETSSYVSAVLAQLVKVNIVFTKEDVLIPPEKSLEVWGNVIRAMYRVECGAKAASQPTTWQEIARGWRMAYYEP